MRLPVSLSGKTVLITGGTGTLGQALTKTFLEAGAQVFFTYHSRTQESADLEKKGASSLHLDLSDMTEIEKTAQALRSKIQSLDVLIHNAAAVRDSTIANMSEEDWDYVLSVDLKAPYYLTKKTMPLLFRSAQAKIFFMTSRVGLLGGYGVSNYAAAKAGLIGLTKSLAQELGKKKILVNAVNPGFMRSRMTQAIPQAAIDANLAANPLQAWSSPDEVADFILYLCSDRMTQATGQVFHFEGRKT